jgi:hypothetical protein
MYVYIYYKQEDCDIRWETGPAQSLGELGTRLGPPFDKAQKKI